MRQDTFVILQRLAAILYKAAEEHGYLNPHNIETILGITKETTVDQDTTKDGGINGKKTSLSFQSVARKPFTSCVVSCNIHNVDKLPFVMYKAEKKRNK